MSSSNPAARRVVSVNVCALLWRLHSSEWNLHLDFFTRARSELLIKKWRSGWGQSFSSFARPTWDTPSSSLTRKENAFDPAAMQHTRALQASLCKLGSLFFLTCAFLLRRKETMFECALTYRSTLPTIFPPPLPPHALINTWLTDTHLKSCPLSLVVTLHVAHLSTHSGVMPY